MTTKNCPNCMAPYEPALNKCPYCGTSYYDMSGIDFTDHKPFYLKIKTKIGNTLYYITQLVIPSLGSIETSMEYADVCGGVDNTLPARYNTGTNITTNISFTAIADKNNNLMTVKEE